MTESLKQLPGRITQFLLCAALVVVLGLEGAHGQQTNVQGNNVLLGTWDASQAARTNNSRTGTGSPVSRDACNRAGESYFQINATPGLNNWYCTTPGSPGTWTNGNSGGAGTVTSVSAGDLTPLFTTSVATPTSTPALSFTLSNFSADNILGNFTGAPAVPSTQAIPSCANDGSHALVYPSHTLTCEAITTFTWPSAGIMVSTGSAAGTSLTTTSGLQGITFTAGVPSLTELGTAATSNSNVFQSAITGVANEVFGGTGPGMISLTSSYLPLSAMGIITGGTWNGSVIAGAYGGTGVNNAGFTLALAGNVTFSGSFNPTFSIPSSSTWTFQSGGGTLAQTGADINGSNQVTSTHLSSPLPFSQGGLGTSTNFAAHTWFGNNTGSTAAPSAQQPACADLSNATNSCSIDATNAANISTGTLGAARQANTTYAAYFGGGLSAATVAGSTTDYITTGVSTPGAAIGLKVWPVTQACTLRNLIVFTTGAQPSGGSLVFTLYDNGASTPGTLGSSTGLTVTFAASASAGIQEDSTDTYAVSANHWLTLQVVNNSSSTSATISAWAVACEPN